MNIIPLTVLDGFFDDPDAVREFALAQEFRADPDARWPGERTQHLADLNPQLFNQLCRRYFSLFWPVKSEPNLSWVVNATFQRVQGSYGAGWVHHDSHASILSGIIYLTPNSPLSGGTSIYRRRNSVIFPAPELFDHKQAALRGELDADQARHWRGQNNDLYEETVTVKNVYNRLITFDASQHHAAGEFFGHSDDARLTLVFFVDQLSSPLGPVQRLRNQVD